MAELVVRVPGYPEAVVRLPPKGVVIGRGDDCDVQLLEVRASKRHLSVAPLTASDGRRTWVATDLHSSNGTTLGGEKLLRRGLSSGDVLRVGDTTIELREVPGVAVASPSPSASAPVVVSGSLRLERVGAPARPGTPEAVPAALPQETADDADAETPAPRGPSLDERRARRAGAQSIARAVAFAVVAGVVVVAVNFLAGGVRDDRLRKSEEAKAYATLLGEWARPVDVVEASYRRFEERFPTSPYLLDLAPALAAKKAASAQHGDAEEVLDAILRGGSAQPDSDVLGRLLEVRWRVEGDPRLSKRVDLALAEVARRRSEAAARDWKAADEEVSAALERNDPAAAVRRLRGFRAGHPGLVGPDADRLRTRETTAREGAKALADRAVAAAASEQDPDRRRRVLLDALAGLSATGEEDRVVAALHLVRGGRSAEGPPAGTTPGLPAATPPPSVTQDLLAKAAEAATMVRDRKWAAAARAYASIAEGAGAPRFKEEWSDRATELGRVVSLVKDLADSIAASDKPVRIRLTDLEKGGVFDVVSADVDVVRLRRGERERAEGWAALTAPDVLALLARPKPTPDQRLAYATLAAELGERKACVEALLPLVDLPSHRDLAFLLAARRLDGRPTVPPGGYLVFDGDLVDQAEHGRRVEAKHVAALEAEAAGIVAKVAADPAMKKLDALAAKRDELDRRRAYALLAIFNEKHWPYPHDAPSIRAAYESVWQEIVGRTRAVEELWGDPFAVKLGGKGGPVDKLLSRHAAIVAELAAKRRDTAPLRAAIARYALYAGESQLTIRTYYRDAEERERFEYDRWVMGTFNPAHTTVATPPEVEQTRITNEYRVMMGYAMAVKPGDAAIEAITGDTVVKILDSATEIKRVPIRAVRIDDRLVASARAHSLDMQRRGFFAHFAPPAGNEPGTSPFERMAKAGYQGHGGSENIAKSGSALDAHLAWLHSSGHHRNILSDWLDQGVGQGGQNWTQNFGFGGGGPPEIPGRVTTETEPADEGDGTGEDGK
jgi:hypothetical protein